MPRLHPDQLQQAFWLGPRVSWFLKLTRWFQCVAAKAALSYLHRWILLHLRGPGVEVPNGSKWYIQQQPSQNQRPGLCSLAPSVEVD